MRPDDLWQGRVETRPDRVVVTLAGELDVTTVPALRDLLAEAVLVNPVVDVDVARLTFLDSTILSVLVAAHQVAVNAGGTLTLLNPTGHVRRILTITGILPLLEAGTA